MKLLEWRTARKLSQRDVADAIGVTAMSVSRIEKGAQQPSPEVAQRIDDFTDGAVSAASLLGLSERRPRKRGVSEESHTYKGSETLSVMVPLSAGILKDLRDFGVDAEGVARTGAQQAIKEAYAQAWREANRDAVAAYNVWIEKHGTLAEQLGLI